MGIEISAATLAWIEVASVAASAAGAAVSYSAQQTAAKQSELNAKAQSDAIHQEQVRQQQVTAENMRRQAAQDKRFRSAQLAQMSGQGIVPTAGTPLDILADTAVEQQRHMQDQAYQSDVTQRELAYQSSSTLQMGRISADQQRSAAGATLLSGLASAAGSAYGMNSNRPKTTSTTTTRNSFW